MEPAHFFKTTTRASLTKNTLPLNNRQTTSSWKYSLLLFKQIIQSLVSKLPSFWLVVPKKHMNKIKFFLIKILPTKRKKMPFTQTLHFLQLKLTLKIYQLTFLTDKNTQIGAQYVHLSDKPIFFVGSSMNILIKFLLKNNNLRKMLFLTT